MPTSCALDSALKSQILDFALDSSPKILHTLQMLFLASLRTTA